MKIEKINDNQIRCTLTKEDLDSHQIRISELAYGTEKAKRLFRDMMQQAQIQFGFEADNIPQILLRLMEPIISLIFSRNSANPNSKISHRNRKKRNPNQQHRIRKTRTLHRLPKILYG